MVRGPGVVVAGRKVSFDWSQCTILYFYFEFVRHQTAGIFYIPWPIKKLLPKTLISTSPFVNIGPKLDSLYSQRARAAKNELQNKTKNS